MHRGHLNFPGALWSVQGPSSLIRDPSDLTRDCAGCFVALPTCSGAPPAPTSPGVPQCWLGAHSACSGALLTRPGALSV